MSHAADPLATVYDRAIPLVELPLRNAPTDPIAGDPVAVTIRGRLAYWRRGQVGVYVEGWAAPVALHLLADPGRGIPNEQGPDITVEAAPPQLAAGEVYAARSTGARYFVVGDADGVRLVDALGNHWPPDLVVREWGPLDPINPTAVNAADGVDGAFYDRADDTAAIPPVPAGIDGYAVSGRPVSPAPVGWPR